MDVLNSVLALWTDFTQEVLYAILFLLVFLAAELFSLRFTRKKYSASPAFKKSVSEPRAFNATHADGSDKEKALAHAGGSDEETLERDEARIMCQLGGDTKTSAELVQTIIDLPRKEYLGSFHRVVLLITILLKHSPEIGSVNWRAPRDVIVRWLLERNSTQEDVLRVLQLINTTGRQLLLLDVFLTFGARIGRQNLRKKYHKNKKTLYATVTLIMDVLAQLKKCDYFPRVVALLPLEEIKSEAVIQAFVTTGIECDHFKVTEVALLETMYSGSSDSINWGKIFQLLLTAYIQAKSLYAAQNFVTKVRPLGLPAEQIDGLEFRVHYEKTKANASTRTVSPSTASTTEKRSSHDDIWRETVVAPKGSVRGGRTVRWYTTAISDCGEKGDWKRAIEFLDEITQVGLTPDTISYSAAINACAKGLQWEKALKLFQTMKQRGLPLNERVYGACLNACAKAKQWERALILLDEMRKKENGVKPNVYNYGAAISACECAKEFEQAIGLFDDMKVQGLQPNLIIYSLVISACWKADKNALAFKLYTEMKQDALIPNAITYRLLLTGAVKAGYWEHVEILKEDMQRYGVELARSDTHTFSTVPSDLSDDLRDHSSTTSAADHTGTQRSSTPSSSSVSSACDASYVTEQCGLAHTHVVRDDHQLTFLLRT